MGNSSTKEHGAGRNFPRHGPSESPGGPSEPSEGGNHGPSSVQSIYSTRTRRNSRPDLAMLLGATSTGDRDVTSLEARRETKQEREARRAEKERVARKKERERSMREEHVDGGYLVTQGVYTGVEDFSKDIVRHLMIERRVAPFWRGLNDHSESWTEHQLVAVVQGRPLPAPDEIPEEEPPDMSNQAPDADSAQTHRQITESLTVPISSRAQSFTSEASSNASPVAGQLFPGSGGTPPTTSSIGSALSRGRAKTLTSLTESSKTPQTDMKLKESQLPKDPNVNGQPIEAYLYKDALECPICFLYYPKYLNKTRCCDQAICSECFVQIKRPDPHPPEHAHELGTQQPNDDTDTTGAGDELVSEPAQCPYCNQPEFGITYEPPVFRRGLIYANLSLLPPTRITTSAMSSSSSLASGHSVSDRFAALSVPHRRTTSISASDPMVITTDRVRPDWHQKLTAARAHAARRSAAATALHTAAYLMGNRGHDSDGRSFGAFGRRGILRRTSGADSPSGASASSQLGMLALMSERYAAQAGNRASQNSPTEADFPADSAQRSNTRRRRVEDLEEMMMMEAIRLSIASEEERRRREQKDSRKEAKKKDKENRKAEKTAKKGGSNVVSPNEPDPTMENSKQNVDQSLDATGKGKAAEQLPPDQWTAQNPHSMDPQSHLERARQQISSNENHSLHSSTPYRPSHLRTLSNASSSASSIDESAPASPRYDIRDTSSSTDVSPHASGTNIPGTANAGHYLSETPPASTSAEPMFNFRSLAAMVGETESAQENTSQDMSSSSELRHRQQGNDAVTESNINKDPATEHHTHVTGPLTSPLSNADSAPSRSTPEARDNAHD